VASMPCWLLFRPRLYLESHFINNNPIDLVDRYASNTIEYSDELLPGELDLFLKANYKSQSTELDNIISNCNAITMYSNLLKIKTWLIIPYYMLLKK
jgi:hypothetical protein